MKNKKLLLVAVGAMGLVAVATAGVGTAAWYSATSNATVNAGTAAMTNTVSGSESSVAALNLYAKFTVAQTVATAALTSSDGYCYAIVNGYLQAASPDPALTAKYATVTVSFQGWYQEAACSNAATDSQKARIAADSSVTVYVGGDNDPERTRTSASTPANLAAFATTFGNTLGNRTALTFTFNAGGTVKTGNNAPVYVAICGEESLMAKAALDDLINTNAGFKTDSSTVSQTIKVFATNS